MCFSGCVAHLEPDPSRDTFVAIDFQSGAVLFLKDARISRLERTRVDRLNGTLAATEGLGSADELRATLRRFYPHLRDADPVRVLHFALEARPGEDEQEAVALT